MLHQWRAARFRHYDFEREISQNQARRQENFLKSASELEDEHGVDQ